MGIHRLSMGDRQDPRAEVRIPPQPRVRPERGQERLLETVLGLISTDQRHQEPIDVLAMRVEEILKRWNSHSRLNAPPGHRVRSPVLSGGAERHSGEAIPLGEKPRGKHEFVAYPRRRRKPLSVTLGPLRRIVFLSDPPPDQVLPAAMMLGADVKTESLSVDALARLPDLDPEFVLADATTDPERTFGVLSTLRAAGSAVPVLVVLFPETAGRYPWQEVADEFVYPNAAEAELRLRLEMIRARRGDAGQGVIRFGPVTINVETYQVIADGRPLDLTYKEFELIRFLAQNPGRVFTRARLLREVWGYDFYGGTRTVDVHVRRLRAKLGPEHEHLIETVRGVGYRAAEAVG